MRSPPMIPVLLLLAVGGLMHAAGTFAPNSAVLAGPELAFGFLLLAAYFTGKLLNRFGLPKLTGYILAGIVAGPYVLGLVDKSMTAQLKMVGSAATAILALQAGAELSLREIRPLFGTLRALAFYAVFGTMIALTALLVLIRPLIPFLDALPFTAAVAVAGALGVAMSAQSPAVVMALIGETRSDGIVSRTMLAMVVMADLAVITLYGVASSLATAVVKGDADPTAAIAAISWEVFGSLGVGIAMGFVLARFMIHVKQGVGLFAVMLCFVCAEVGNAVHLDPLIIMLAAGIYVRNFSRADAHTLIDPFDAAAYPVYMVFFALAGAKLDLSKLFGVLLPVALIVVTRASSFYVGSKIATARSDADPAVKKFAWFGLVPQAGLALALAELVRRTFPEFGDAAFALVVGVVACNEMIAPVILRIALLRSGEAGKRATHDFAGDH
jgi:Kef-type K+ transport system membrane component KefB